MAEPGQAWAYRARSNDELVQVKVLKLGERRPPRVLVRFLDDTFEGREEWVSPARLKVLWDDVAEFRAREERWERIFATGLPLDDPREDAAEHVIGSVFDSEEVFLGYREWGALHIKDPMAVAGQLGLEPGQLTGHPDVFIEDGMTIVPWQVTELIATTAARKNPLPLLEELAEEERVARLEAIHGRWSPGGRRSSDHYFSPEVCVESDKKYSRPRREVLRAWCGAEAVDYADELIELRKEIRRVGQVAQSAIDALRAAGEDAQATRLEHELGVPLEMLRHTAGD